MDRRAVILWSISLALVALASSPRATWAQDHAPKAPVPLICQGADMTKRATCERYCAQVPVGETCLLGLRFGPAAPRAFIAYQRQLMSGGLPDPRALAKREGLSAEDAKRFVLYLRAIGAIQDTIASPMQRPERLSVLQDVSSRCASIGGADAALLACLNRQLQLEREVFGADALATVATLERLAQAYIDQDKPRAAYPHYEAALKLVLAAQPDHPWSLSLLFAWAEAAYAAHDYALGLAINKQAMRSSAQLLGTLHPRLAFLYDQRGRLCIVSHQYAEARQWIARARDVRVLTQGLKHTETALAYHTYGKLLIRLNDRQAAYDAYRSAVKIIAQSAPKSALHGLMLHDLGMAIARRGDYAQAERVFLEAKAIFEAAPEGVPLSALETLLSNLAEVVMYQGRLDEAQSYLEQCEPLLAKIGADGRPTPDHARHAQNLAKLAAARKDHTRAYAHRRRALSLYEAVWPKTHPELLAMRAAVAHDMLAQGQLKQAAALHRETMALARQHVELNVESVWNDTQRLSFLAQMSAQLELAYALFEPEEALNAALSWQGLATRQEQLNADLSYLREGLTPEAQRTLDAILAAQRRGELVSAVKDPKASALLGQNAALEAWLKAPRWPDAQAICQQLEQRKLDSLIIYQRYLRATPPVSADAGAAASSLKPHYLAMVLSRAARGRCAVTRHELGDAASLDASMATWQQALRKAERCYQDKGQPALCYQPLRAIDSAGAALYKQVYAPLKPALNGAKRVAVISDGALAQLPLASLPEAVGGPYLIESTTLSALTSAWALLRPKLASPATGPALVMGDVDYAKASPLGLARRCEGGQCQAQGQAMTPTPASPTLASVRAGDDAALCGYKVNTWPPMLATEAAAVAAQLSKNNPSGASLIQGQDATLEAFLTQHHGAPTIHIATHGFYSPASQCQEFTVKSSEGLLNLWDLERPLVDPLMLSALVFAGADQRSAPASPSSSEVETPPHGILSARHLAGLRGLRQTSLVVLSACQSGLGELIPGEGALSLARSFAIAGVDRTIYALWKIPSAPTTALFELFYAQPTQDAAGLRAAQLKLLGQYRARGLKASSLLWGAFVALDG